MARVLCGVLWTLPGKLRAIKMTCRNTASFEGKCWIHARMERHKRQLARRAKCAHAIYMPSSKRVRGCACLAMEGSIYCRHHKDQPTLTATAA